MKNYEKFSSYIKPNYGQEKYEVVWWRGLKNPDDTDTWKLET